MRGDEKIASTLKRSLPLPLVIFLGKLFYSKQNRIPASHKDKQKQNQLTEERLGPNIFHCEGAIGKERELLTSEAMLSFAIQ